jgi:hypothetical protein
MASPSSVRPSNSATTMRKSLGRTKCRRRPAAAASAWSMIGLLALVPLADLAAPTDAHAGGFLEETAPRNTDKKKYAVPAKRLDVQGEGLQAIEADLENAKLAVGEAIQNEEAAAQFLKRARHRSYPRGAALEELRANATDTHRERIAAEQTFQATVEKARRLGVPNGTLMDYEDYAVWITRQNKQNAQGEQTRSRKP